MVEFNLEKSDLNKLKSIFKININIHKLYSKLALMEKDSMKDSLEYKKHLEYLSMFIDEENKVYNSISNDIDTSINFLNFLIELKSNKHSSLKSSIINYDDDVIIILRIINTFLSRLTTNYNYLMESSDKQLSTIMSLTGINLSGSFENKDKYSSVILKSAIERDIYYLFLAFIQEHINKFKISTLKNIAINEKYNTIFINKDSEMVAISNSFNIPTDLFISSDINAKLLDVSPSFYRNIKDSYCGFIVNTCMYDLLDISNFDYNDMDKVALSIRKECFIRAAFLFMSDEKISDINFGFHEFIDDDEFMELYPDNNVSIELIKQRFNEIKKDRKKVKRLSI